MTKEPKAVEKKKLTGFAAVPDDQKRAVQKEYRETEGKKDQPVDIDTWLAGAGKKELKSKGEVKQ